MFHISCDKGSGEYGLGSILAPGAFARDPLINRLPDKLRCDVTFIYGDKDWMDYRHAIALKNKMGSARVCKVPNAGHQLFSENSDYFNQLLSKILMCEEVPEISE